jgi:hypothetical protein
MSPQWLLHQPQRLLLRLALLQHAAAVPTWLTSSIFMAENSLWRGFCFSMNPSLATSASLSRYVDLALLCTQERQHVQQ